MNKALFLWEKYFDSGKKFEAVVTDRRLSDDLICNLHCSDCFFLVPGACSSGCYVSDDFVVALLAYQSGAHEDNSA
jgi:hypothetical protein